MTVDPTKMIHILTSIEQLGGITSAAEHLFVSQPYLRRTLKDTESELNLTLIDRSSKPTRLTYAGHVYLSGLQQVQHEINYLNQSMREIAQSKAGNISIALSESMAQIVLPKIAATFHDRYPTYTLNIKELPSIQAINAVIDNQIDVYLGPKPKHFDHFLYRSMTPLRFNLYGQYLPDKLQMLTTPSQLKSNALTPTILLSDEMVTGSLIKDWLTSNQVLEAPTVTVNNVFTALKLVSNGMGTTILPEIPQDLLPNHIQQRPIAPQFLSSQLILAHRSSKTNTHEMIDFLTVAQDIFGINPATQQILSDDS